MTDQQPQPSLEPAKPFYTRTWFIVVAVIVMLFIAANMSGDDTADTSSPPPPDPVAEEPEPVVDEPDPPKRKPKPGIGDRARDGQFTFKVRSVKCGETSVGDQYFAEEAQGHFCRVTMRVRNHGDESGVFFVDNQLLIDDRGAEHAADSEATFVDSPDSDLVWSDINPGNAVTVSVLFDIPPNREPRRLRLHDSAFSGGTLVVIGGDV